jgi:hypothetical protein
MRAARLRDHPGKAGFYQLGWDRAETLARRLARPQIEIDLRLIRCCCGAQRRTGVTRTGAACGLCSAICHHVARASAQGANTISIITT